MEKILPKSVTPTERRERNNVVVDINIMTYDEILDPSHLKPTHHLLEMDRANHYCISKYICSIIFSGTDQKERK